jgi:hypothetical protein
MKWGKEWKRTPTPMALVDADGTFLSLFTNPTSAKKIKQQQTN